MRYFNPQVRINAKQGMDLNMRCRISIIATLCAVFFVLLSTRIQGEESAASSSAISPSTTKADGLETIGFDTLEGTVEVALPEDVSASDTISGTVIAEPKGQTKEEIAQNEDELSGYVVEIAKTQEVKEPPQLAKAQDIKEEPESSASEPDKPTEPQDKVLPPGSYPEATTLKTAPELKLGHEKEQAFTCLVPPAAKSFTIILKKKNGKELCRKEITSAPACKAQPSIKPSSPPKCQFPAGGTCGKPIRVPGTCDGRSRTSNVKVNGRSCRVLAESPRAQIVRAPKNSSGQCKIESSECGFIRRGTIKLLPFSPEGKSTSKVPASSSSATAVQAPPRHPPPLPVEKSKPQQVWKVTRSEVIDWSLGRNEMRQVLGPIGGTYHPANGIEVGPDYIKVTGLWSAFPKSVGKSLVARWKNNFASPIQNNDTAYLRFGVAQEEFGTPKFSAFSYATASGGERQDAYGGFYSDPPLPLFPERPRKTEIRVDLSRVASEKQNEFEFWICADCGPESRSHQIRFRWVLSSVAESAASTSLAPPVQDLGEPTPAVPPALSSSPPNPAPSPGQRNQELIKQVQAAQLQQLREIRQLEFDRIIDMMSQKSAETAESQSRLWQSKVDETRSKYKRLQESLESDLERRGCKIAFVDYRKILQNLSSGKQLLQSLPELQARVDAERQLKSSELGPMSRRNPQLAMQMAKSWQSDLCSRQKGQLDALQSRWSKWDLNIQVVCAQEAAKNNFEFVSFRSPTAKDMTDEVLRSLSANN